MDKRNLKSHAYVFHALGKDRPVSLWREEETGNTYVRSKGKFLPVALQFLGRTTVLLRWSDQHFLFHAEKTPNGLRLLHGPDQWWIKNPASPTAKLFEPGAEGSKIPVKSQIPGLVVGIHFRENQLIKEGQTLLLIEAMKMQNPVKAPCSGKIVRVFVGEGSSVESGATLAEIERVTK